VGLGRVLVKSWLGLLAGDYWLYKIYSLELEPDPPQLEVDSEIEIRTMEEDPDAWVLGGYIGGQHAATCWIWWADRYQRERGWLPLKNDEAKLVHIETKPNFRGRGVAGALLQEAHLGMRKRGFVRLWARIWHNNAPSVRVFLKAGWRYDRTILELEPFRLGRRLQLNFRGRR
jgi:GNAT superfamily N-acetyltransferase